MGAADTCTVSNTASRHSGRASVDMVQGDWPSVACMRSSLLSQAQ